MTDPGFMPFLGTLNVTTPRVTPYFLTNIVCLICTSLFLGWRFFSNKLVIVRLPFFFILFVCIFYQLPLTAFSNFVETGLKDPWIYSLAVNGAALALVIYSLLTRQADPRYAEFHIPHSLPQIYLITLFAGFLSLFLYVYRVPWSCTGFHALISDPSRVLLARELGVKLIGTSLATYAWGAYANAIAPIMTLTSLWLIKAPSDRWRLVRIFLGLATGFAALVFLFISGTKGQLIPMFIMLMAGAYFLANSWSARIFMIVLLLVFVFASLAVFELLKERGNLVGSKYDFAACSAKMGTCKRSLELLDSLVHRDDSLGMPRSEVKLIRERLVCICNDEGDGATCPSDTINVEREAKAAQTEHMRRGFEISQALFYRAIVVPFQVSIWHFKYAETESYVRVKTLPFAKHLTGDSLNMAELVYQKYGAVYSQGDRTSTSTAPTGFFIHYPAHLGFAGFLLSLACIVILDIVLIKLSIIAGAPLAPLVVGIVAIITINFMTSDFVTVLLSHGGGVGISLIGVYAVLSKLINKDGSRGPKGKFFNG